MALTLFAGTAFLLWFNGPLLAPEQPVGTFSAADLAGFQSLDRFLGLEDVDPISQEDLDRHSMLQQHRSDAAAAMQLQRSLAAVDTELWVDDTPSLGACAGDTPLLPHMPAEACWSLHCLWSARAGGNIDMWFNALGVLDANVLPAHCPEAAGGQVPHAGGAQPGLTVALLVPDSDADTAAQTLLEAFRVAREVASAEFIVACRMGEAQQGALHEVARRIRRLFGTVVQFVGAEAEQDAGAAATLVQQALRAATAEQVLLLQSGVLLTRGSLSALLLTLEARGDAAMVGPLLVSGRDAVAHAGGSAAADGSVTVRASSGGAIPHELLSMRPVDVLSLACVAGRRAVLMATLGQVDTQHPAAALATAVLADMAGLKAIYQPLAVARYIGLQPLQQPAMLFSMADLMAASTGTVDATVWSEFRGKLRSTNSGDSGRQQQGPRALWVAGAAGISGSTIGISRRLQMMQAMVVAGYDVRLQPVARLDIGDLQLARWLGVDVLPSEQPSHMQFHHQGQCQYAVVLVTVTTLQPIKELLRSQCPHTPVVLDIQDLQWIREAREFLSLRDMRSWDFPALSRERLYNWVDSSSPLAKNTQALLQKEMEMVDASNLTIVANAEQQAMIQHFRPGANVHVVGNMLASSSRSPACAGRHGILFTASQDTKSSQVAVDWLIAMVVPRVLAQLPARVRRTITIHIAGDVSIAPKAAQFATVLQRIYIHQNLHPAAMQLLYNTVKVVAAPFASGSFQLDILQAMAMHVPVVTTPVGVEGLQITSNRQCLVGDSFDAFAKHVVALYTSCNKWQTIADQAFQYVSTYNHIDTAQQMWLHVLTSAAVRPTLSDSQPLYSDDV